MIGYHVKGDLNKTYSFLEGFVDKDLRFYRILKETGERGVEALRAATPKDSGITAESWSYKINVENGVGTIEWHNSSIAEKYNIAILLQYGHATGTGGYVSSVDYINPAMGPVFTYLANEVWKEVKR